MNYHNITKDDMLNGEGLRIVLWVAGCEHYCHGCHNPETWGKDSGIPFDFETECELFESLSKDYISGITFSGGDPLYPCNRDIVLTLCKKIRYKFPDKNIWMYTGYTWEQLSDLHEELSTKIDILIDGEFEIEKCDSKLNWRGSSNQRIINVKESIIQDRVVLATQYYEE